MKVLITGAAGAVGTVLAAGLRDRHQLRGFDREEMPDLTDAIVGDIGDFDRVCMVPRVRAAPKASIAHFARDDDDSTDHGVQAIVFRPTPCRLGSGFLPPDIRAIRLSL